MATLLGVALFQVLALASAGADSDAADEDQWKSLHPPLAQLALYHDGKGHYLALRPMQYDPAARRIIPAVLYYGDGKTFWFVESSSELKDHRSQSVASLSDPYRMEFTDYRFMGRGGTVRQAIERVGDRVVLSCGKRKRAFVPVDEEKLRRIAARARQEHTVGFRWQSHLLARDIRGNYFYVDEEIRGGPYKKRLYRGRRARMKRVKLRDVVVDTEGELYVAKSGTLKVGKGLAVASWVDAKNVVTDLVVVDTRINRNRRFIHTDLGVYLGKKRGTPCDWL